MSSGQPLSRRHFLQAVALMTALSVAGALSAWRWGAALWLSLRSRLQERLTNPALADAPTGPLPEAIVSALVVTTKTLVDTEVETTHYAAFFRWRAETLGGYRALYERFVAALDRAAKEAGEADFAACEITRRRRILQQSDLTGPADRASRLYALVFGRDSLRFEKYIVREILELFSRTDGWVLLGYGSWPGTPRGLDSYTKAPGGA